ncbi:TPA: hypothetical protein DCQ44_02120 [Candidatus Taylorbacteria bacterium]|nr:hypothetical protein [Candidatus Taylorbacteria bacterium]
MRLALTFSFITAFIIIVVEFVGILGKPGESTYLTESLFYTPFVFPGSIFGGFAALYFDSIFKSSDIPVLTGYLSIVLIVNLIVYFSLGALIGGMYDLIKNRDRVS